MSVRGSVDAGAGTRGTVVSARKSLGDMRVARVNVRAAVHKVLGRALSGATLTPTSSGRCWSAFTFSGLGEVLDTEAGVVTHPE
jgi:hypothetical protein